MVLKLAKYMPPLPIYIYTILCYIYYIILYLAITYLGTLCRTCIFATVALSVYKILRSLKRNTVETYIELYVITLSRHPNQIKRNCIKI